MLAVCRPSKETQDPRQFFETRCLFVWNARSRACWLEAYTPLVEDSSLLSLDNNGSVQRNPARREAQKLKSLDLGFFNVPLLRPIRYFEHLVFDNIRFGEFRMNIVMRRSATDRWQIAHFIENILNLAGDFWKVRRSVSKLKSPRRNTGEKWSELKFRL